MSIYKYRYTPNFYKCIFSWSANTSLITLGSLFVVFRLSPTSLSYHFAKTIIPSSTCTHTTDTHIQKKNTYYLIHWISLYARVHCVVLSPHLRIAPFARQSCKSFWTVDGVQCTSHLRIDIHWNSFINLWHILIKTVKLLLNAQQYSKESIQQLVMEAETLVREEILMKTPSRCRHSFSGPSEGGSRRKPALAVDVSEKGTHPKIKRVQEWLQHQPSCGSEVVEKSSVITDCEASGEYTGMWHINNCLKFWT